MVIVKKGFHIFTVKDPFLTSSHFWPLKDIKQNLLSMDIQTGHNAIFMNGSAMKLDKKDVLVYASTELPGSYIILGDFNGKPLTTAHFHLSLIQLEVVQNKKTIIVSNQGQRNELQMRGEF